MEELEELNLQEVDISELDVSSGNLPPLPATANEYNEDVYYNSSSENRTAEYSVSDTGEVQNYDDGIDWGSLAPVDESGLRNEQDIDFESLTPYDVSEKPATVWDELALKKDMGNYTQYRAQLARDVMRGKISLEEAQGMGAQRYQETLNKYGVTKVPEFSFASFKANPFKTMFGEAAEMLPFYWNGMKKGAAASLITVPAAVGKNAAAGAAAGSIAPGAGNATGGGVGIVSGIIEGVNNGMLIGTFLESMEVEGGNLYMDLREKGVSHETALSCSLAGGVLNGMLETASFGVMTAPIKGAAKKAVAKTMFNQLSKSPAAQKAFKSTVAKVLMEYSKRTGTEVTTEMIQDVTNNVMSMLAAQADSVEDAKPTGEDWMNILKQTGPKTLAASLVMGAIGIPFDAMNANVGSIKSNGGSEIATKAEIEQNLQDLADGKAVVTGGDVLQGHLTFNASSEIAFDSVADSQTTINELEAELKESQESIAESEQQIARLEKKPSLTEEEQYTLENHKKSIAFHEEYQKLVMDEITKTSEKMNNTETKQSRKQELTEKGKKEKLSAEELQELNDIWIEEEKTKSEKDINERTQKARERELDKNIRDNDRLIEKAQKREDNARENRNKIEEQQDANNEKIQELEKENAEIDKALENTDIEADVAEMKATKQKNIEHINSLKKNNRALEKQRAKANREIENAIAEQEQLGQVRNDLDLERSKLQEGIINENGQIDMTAGGYKNAQLSALKSKLNAMQQGIKRGIRMARREIRDVQNSATHLIKSSGMNDTDKTRLLASIKDMNSQEKFEKVLPELLNKISELEEKHNKNQLTKYINKLMKRAKPKKGGKTPVGKFSADIQKILDDIATATKMTQEEAYSEIENIFDNAGDRMLTDEETQKVRILNDFGGMESKSSRELLRNARSIKMLLEDGKIAGQFREAQKKAHKEKLLEDAKTSIIGEVQPTGNKKKDKAAFINSIKQSMRKFGAMSETWEGLMTIASLHDKDRKLVKLLDVFPSKMKRIKGEMDTFNSFANQALDALGLKNYKQFADKVKQDNVVIDVGQYTDTNGERVTLQASRAQVRKLYMEMQDPEIRQQLKDNNGYTFKGDIEVKSSGNDVIDSLFNGDTDGMFSVIDKSTEQMVEEFLTPEDIKLIDLEFKFYKDYRKRENAFYREKYGIDMPDNPYYSPIAREVDGSDRTEDWQKRSSYQKSMTPSNFRSRKNNNNKIKLQSDIEVMQNHIAETEHFMAFDDFVTDAKTVFGNSEIREIIRDKYSDSFLRIIDQHLNDIMADGVESIRPEMGVFSKIRNAFTGAALGARAKIFLTQLTAIGVFSDAIPTHSFVKGLGDFFLHPVEATKTLSESYLLKDRQNSINMEIKDIVKSQEYQAITRYKDFRNKLYFFTQLGDKWSIIAGGWSVYKHTLNSTGDKAAAMEAFERAVNKYQQSGHIDNLSSWQRGNPMQKAMVMFMSDQMRQMQAEVRAVKDAIILKDANSIKQAAKTVVIMHLVLPNLVQFVSNGFAWDDEDQLKASILGPFTSIAIMGQVLSSGLALAMKYYGAKTDNPDLQDMDIFEGLDMNVFGPFNRLCQDVSKYIDKIYKDDVEPEDTTELWVKIFKNFIGPFSGIPIKYGVDVWEKTPEYLEDDKYLDVLKLWGGVSPYTIENKGKDKEE